MLSFIDSLWYLWDNTALGILGVIALVCHFWKKIRIYLIPVIAVVIYCCIETAVESYKEAHPPKDRYAEMTVDELIAEMDAHTDSIRRLPTFGFVEKSLKEDYGLSVSPAGYTEKADESGAYDIYGVACSPGESYAFNLTVKDYSGNYEYCDLWFVNPDGRNKLLDMADGRVPDLRQITEQEAMEKLIGG